MLDILQFTRFNTAHSVAHRHFATCRLQGLGKVPTKVPHCGLLSSVHISGHGRSESAATQAATNQEHLDNDDDDNHDENGWLVSWLVGVLSPVNREGLQQGCKRTSIHLQIIPVSYTHLTLPTRRTV